MESKAKQTIISIALIVAGFGAIFGLSNFLESHRPPPPEGYEDEDLALQGKKLKGYTLGFESAIADWYWMRSLQYIGDKIMKSEGDLNLEDLRPLNPRLLYPMLDNATDLDPQFTAVYAYGAVVLPAIDAAQAIKITEKGIAHNPNQWRLYQHLGYIYWRLRNFEKASEIYQKGSEIPGAPPFMQMMAAQMKTQGGKPETARAIYRQMFADAPDAQTRQNAEIRLMELDFFDEREALRQTLKEFQAQNNRCPNNWSEIFPLLKAVKLPDNKDFRVDRSNNLIDPSGAPYILDKQTCDVRLNAGQTKIPLQ